MLESSYPHSSKKKKRVVTISIKYKTGSAMNTTKYLVVNIKIACFPLLYRHRLYKNSFVNK